MTLGNLIVFGKNRLFIKFKVSDADLEKGTSGPALAFKKLFTDLKPLVREDIKA